MTQDEFIHQRRKLQKTIEVKKAQISALQREVTRLEKDITSLYQAMGYSRTLDEEMAERLDDAGRLMEKIGEKPWGELTEKEQVGKAYHMQSVFKLAHSDDKRLTPGTRSRMKGFAEWVKRTGEPADEVERQEINKALNRLLRGDKE